MSTRRMISSDWPRDDFCGELDFFGRLTWLGLITACADDQGRIWYNPNLIKADIFPFDDIPNQNIIDCLNHFHAAGKVFIYEANGKKYIQIVNWWDYQTPSWASPSKYPAPAGWIDRWKYHTKGNKIALANWDMQGGFSPVSTPLPSELPSELPSGQDSRDVNGEGEGEGEEGGAKAPPAQEKPEEKTATNNRNRKSDPRSKTPAIQCAKGIAGQYPPLELYDDVINVLGEHPDGTKLAACRKEWMLRGHNSNGWGWCVDWYSTGIPDRKNGKSPGRPAPPEQQMTTEQLKNLLRSGNGNA